MMRMPKRTEQDDTEGSDTSAIPIESEYAAASLSMADAPIRKRNDQNSHKCVRRCGLTCLVIVLCILAVPIAVRVQVHRHKRSETVLETVLDFLEYHQVSDPLVLRNPGSPQHDAAMWLAEDQGEPSFRMSDKHNTKYVERYVLALIAMAFDTPDWAQQLDFFSENDVCEWNGVKETLNESEEESTGVGGVTCNAAGEVIELDLSFNGLNGGIPTEIGYLTTLQKLDLSENGGIIGHIPTELCKLSNLVSLEMHVNSLNGHFPSCEQWQKLEVIRLDDNDLTGSIPESVCTMNSAKQFDVKRNIMSGSIPSCVDKLTAMRSLKLSDNKFTGTMPEALHAMTNLQQLFIDGNFFSGNPLVVFDEIQSLEFVYAEDNEFHGLLDDNYPRHMKHLMALDLSANNFTSHVFPRRLLQLPELRILDLSMNSLQGHMPDQLEVNSVLWFFSVYKNMLEGGIPSSLTSLVGLKHLDLSDNQFHGPLRSTLFNFPIIENLFLYDLPDLHAGAIPKEVEMLTSLREFSLKNTNRNGTFPNFRNLTNLVVLDLNQNSLAGTMPPSYGQMPQLESLILSSNPLLKGNVPEFSAESPLWTLMLDSTSVGGSFESICRLPVFQEVHSAAIIVNCNVESDCSCCQCCAESCSNPLISSIEWSWEYDFRSQAHIIGVNMSHVRDPSS